MYNDQSKISRKLKKLRQIHALPQKHLAELLAISQSYYSKLETFELPKHYKFIPALAKLYKLHERFLIEDCVLDYYIDDPIAFSREYLYLVEVSSCLE